MRKALSVLKWVWRIGISVALFPLFVLAILALLLYLPPVQKWAVDKVAAIMSEEMQMEVSVESVSLKCPLDLCLNGMLAIQEGDTVLDAEELALSMRLFPLFKGNVEIDDVHLTNTKLNTRELIDACKIRGQVGRLALVSHSTNLTAETAVLNYAILKDADISISMADSIAEDTTESEPVNWKIDLRDVQIENVRVSFDMPMPGDGDNGDSIVRVPMYAYINKGGINGFIDLGQEVYSVDKLTVSGAELGYDNIVKAKDVEIAIDSICYRGTGDLALIINQVAANVYPTIEGVNEGYSIPIVETKGRVEMDSLSLSIPMLSMKTNESHIGVKMKMDFTAFDSINPGNLQLHAQAMVGKGDIQSAISGFMPEGDARELNATLNKYMPNKPLVATIEAGGNMQHLEVSTLNATVEGFAELKSTATLDFDDLKANAKLLAFGGEVTSTAKYNIKSDAYKLDVGIRNLVLNKFVDMEEPVGITGTVKADGKGFDFLDKQTFMNARLMLDKAYYGKMDLSSVSADAQLKGGMLKSNLSCMNEQLRANIDMNANLGSVIENRIKGKSVKESFEGSAVLNVAKADIQAMGFIDTTLVIRTRGSMDFSLADWSSKNPLCLFDIDIKGVDVRTFSDSVTTHSFLLKALTTADSLDVDFDTGDFCIDFSSPYNLFVFIDKSVKLSDAFSKQLSERQLDLYSLKSYLPVMSIDAHAGNDNPITPLLKEYGMAFSDFSLKARTSPEKGITGRGHLYALDYDTVRIDSTYFIIKQDSSYLTYRTAVICNEQLGVPGFRAFLDGYVMPKEADAHLRFFTKKREQGIDLGLHAQTTDSAINIKFYPEQPIIGFRKFQLNDDNHVQLCVSHEKQGEAPELGLIHADVRLRSLSDSCCVTIQAGANESEEQTAHAVVRNLNLSDIFEVIPFAPNIAGLFNMDATYDVHEEQFKVLSDMSLRNFAYEDMAIGNLHSNLVYMPEGTDVHTVDASLDYNDIPIATMQGSYSTTTPEGYLNANLALADVPLSLISPFVPDKLMGFTGYMKGDMLVQGPTDKLSFNGKIITEDVHVLSEPYSLDLRIANDTAYIENSRIKFDHYKIYGAGDTPLDFDGYFDFADFSNMYMALSLYGYNFKLIEAKRTRNAELFGNIYGDIMFRVNGSMSDLSIRGVINVLSKTDLTYVMKESTISQGDRLDDIVTFVDFNAPPDTTKVRPQAMGIDMRVSLRVEDGAKFNCEFSADRQSYVTLRSGGQVTMTYTPEGVLNVVGRITVTEGVMKYTLPIIPLKTFNIASGSYVDFNGNVMNPTLNIIASERTRASVSSEGASARSVAFDVGVHISNTLSDMGLQFTIDAPEDAVVKDELSGYTDEEKNKLAVALLATGMYLSPSNTSGSASNNALNSFLQSEINNLTGKALNSVVDVSVGIDNTTYANGETGTDYSFKFSKRFFSDRLTVIVGGRVSSSNSVNQSTSAGSFIDDVSLEWRLDDSATRYIHLFHGRDYNNIMEGVLEKNGIGLLLRKKVDKVTDLFIFGKKRKQ